MPIKDVPLSEVCVCGVTSWHAMVDRVLWCRRCGAMRLIFERYWHVPLDRAGDLSASIVIKADDEPPTNPGTPVAKKSGASIRAVTDDDVEFERWKPPSS